MKYRGRERFRDEGGEEATKKEKQEREGRSSERGFSIFRSPPGKPPDFPELIIKFAAST